MIVVGLIWYNIQLDQFEGYGGGNSWNSLNKPKMFSTETAKLDGLVQDWDVLVQIFDCSWSLLNHGVAQRMRLNLGNLNPIYERELIKLGVYHVVDGS